jgi:hypothetical protein
MVFYSNEWLFHLFNVCDFWYGVLFHEWYPVSLHVSLSVVDMVCFSWYGAPNLIRCMCLMFVALFMVYCSINGTLFYFMMCVSNM